MKTDPSIYEYLETGPEALRVLSGGLTLSGAYRFRSLTLKGIERRLDGVYEPEDHAGPVQIVEFLAQPVREAWFNLLTKIGLYGEEHPEREVRGLLVFLRAADDPGAPPGAVPPLCAAAYLDETLPAWLEREPDNPYVAALSPLIIKRDADLRARAPAAWGTIRGAALPSRTRAVLERMFECWLIERLPKLTKEELRTMLPTLVPLEQTRAYQDIFAEGEAKGRTDGEAKGRTDGEAKGRTDGEAKGRTQGRAHGLKLLLTRRFGALPAWAGERVDGADSAQLDDWLLGVLDARTLEDLLGPEPQRGESAGP